MNASSSVPGCAMILRSNDIKKRASQENIMLAILWSCKAIWQWMLKSCIWWWWNLHGNSYSSHWHQLMVISIARWLAASMWDFFLFCLLHTTSIVIFYSTYSAMSMAHAHVLHESWKVLRTSKVWNSCLACHRGCAWFEYFVWWRWSIARPSDFEGITFFGHVILKRHDCFISMLEVLLFLCQIIDYSFESLVS